MSSKLKIFFTVSVLFNVFLFGLFGGTYLNKMQDVPFSHVNQEVSPESRHLMARSFQRVNKDTKIDTAQMRRVQQGLKKALEAETFDEGDFDKAVKQAKAMNDKMMDKKVAMIKELFVELPLSERKKLSGRVIQSFSKQGKVRRKNSSRNKTRAQNDPRQM